MFYTQSSENKLTHHPVLGDKWQGHFWCWPNKSLSKLKALGHCAATSGVKAIFLYTHNVSPHDGHATGQQHMASNCLLIHTIPHHVMATLWEQVI